MRYWKVLIPSRHACKPSATECSWKKQVTSLRRVAIVVIHRTFWVQGRCHPRHQRKLVGPGSTERCRKKVGIPAMQAQGCCDPERPGMCYPCVLQALCCCDSQNAWCKEGAIPRCHASCCCDPQRMVVLNPALQAPAVARSTGTPGGRRVCYPQASCQVAVLIHRAQEEGGCYPRCQFPVRKLATKSKDQNSGGRR
jgi:hypothetical protein